MSKKESARLSASKKCPVCAGQKYNKYWAMPGYSLARCEVCSMVWDPFPPEDEKGQYDKSYFQNDNPKGGYTNYFEGMRINKKTFSDRLNKIEKRFGKGKLLDVGCALGDCLSEARKLGWKDAEGVEVSSFAVSVAKKKGLKVTQGTLETVKPLANTFDVVTYQDVIEHIKDPMLELSRVYKILKRNGVIFLVTPDVGGLWQKLLGALWYHYKPREHIMYFSQKSLSLALKKSGFSNIMTKRTYHVLSLEYILSRLKYYSPPIFGLLLNLAIFLKIKDLSFKSYTGEIEAWGQKI